MPHLSSPVAGARDLPPGGAPIRARLLPWGGQAGSGARHGPVRQTHDPMREGRDQMLSKLYTLWGGTTVHTLGKFMVCGSKVNWPLSLHTSRFLCEVSLLKGHIFLHQNAK